MSNEYELKFLNVDKDDIRAKLSASGYEQVKPETLMRRQTYHLPKDHVEHDSKWGRVRDEGDRITATVKWYADPHSPKVSDVHENEIVATDWEQGQKWIQAQGFTPTAYQENTREVWQKPGVNSLDISLDIWPGLKPYIEIEADSVDEVYEAARELGYDPKSGMAGGTEFVYHSELGIEPSVFKKLSAVTFANPPKGNLGGPRSITKGAPQPT